MERLTKMPRTVSSTAASKPFSFTMDNLLELPDEIMERPGVTSFLCPGGPQESVVWLSAARYRALQDRPPCQCAWSPAVNPGCFCSIPVQNRVHQRFFRKSFPSRQLSDRDMHPDRFPFRMTCRRLWHLLTGRGVQHGHHRICRLNQAKNPS